MDFSAGNASGDYLRRIIQCSAGTFSERISSYRNKTIFHLPALAVWICMSECGRTMIAKSTTGKSNSKQYCYFTCYGYNKGKCLAKNSINFRKLEPVVLEGIKAATLNNNLSFSVKNSCSGRRQERIKNPKRFTC